MKDVIPEAVESMQHSKVAFSDAVMAMLKDSIPETSNVSSMNVSKCMMDSMQDNVLHNVFVLIMAHIT